MRNYRTSAATETRYDYGVELVAGLQSFPETAPLAADFEQLNEELHQAYTARRALRPALMKARVAVRFASFEADTQIRSCSKAAEIVDGGRRGPVFKAAFPGGVGPVVAPVGARQMKPTQALLDRLATSKNPAVGAFGAEWKPKIEPVLAKLGAAAEVHKAARAAYDQAFQEEVALREEHRRYVDRLMGEVRAAFPGDRARQDIVFPQLDESGSDDLDEAEAPAEPAEPAEPVTPG